MSRSGRKQAVEADFTALKWHPYAD